MVSLFQITSYLQYWLDAVDEHSLHSPFLFDLYTQVIKPSDYVPLASSTFEQLRKKLLHWDKSITVHDLGAGSQILSSRRTVKQIARTSLSPLKYSALYARLIKHFHFRNIVELGTSLGINALYLGAEPGTSVTTFEGSPEIAEIARTTFEMAEVGNIKIMEGNINATLPEFIQHTSKIDMAFIDANHKHDPTLFYFKNLVSRMHTGSIIIMDDIHYTSEMEKAWNTARNHPLIYGSLDLYRAGILFFDPSLNKQHAVLQF